MVDIKDIAVIHGHVISIALAADHILVNIESGDKAITPLMAHPRTLVSVRGVLGSRVLVQVDRSSRPLPRVMLISPGPESAAAELLLMAARLEGSMPWGRAVDLAAPFFPEWVAGHARKAVQDFGDSPDARGLSMTKGRKTLLQLAAAWVMTQEVAR